MKYSDPESYFSRRAPRYRAALAACPLARTLDLVPYVAAIQALRLDSNRAVRVCDALGGTGFLAHGLQPAGFKFVVCDCCEEMLSGIADVETHITHDDFESVLRKYGPRSFDLVLSHGGLHHVLQTRGDQVDAEASRLRQQMVSSRLAQLVAPGGGLVLADIPEGTPPELPGAVLDTCLSQESLVSVLGRDAASQILAACGTDLADCDNLASLRRVIENRLSTPARFSVPRTFFDQFLAIESECGHLACYPCFEHLDDVFRVSGLTTIGRINYVGPWLFNSSACAAWFFHEMFSVGLPATLGNDAVAEDVMLDVLRQFLGIRLCSSFVSVNWGVTYSIYARQ